MILRTPNGAPVLACDACGCRHFDRTANRCYECGMMVPAAAVAEFEAALTVWQRGAEARPKSAGA